MDKKQIKIQKRILEDSLDTLIEIITERRTNENIKSLITWLVWCHKDANTLLEAKGAKSKEVTNERM